MELELLPIRPETVLTQLALGVITAVLVDQHTRAWLLQCPAETLIAHAQALLYDAGVGGTPT